MTLLASYFVIEGMCMLLNEEGNVKNFEELKEIKGELEKLRDVRKLKQLVYLDDIRDSKRLSQLIYGVD